MVDWALVVIVSVTVYLLAIFYRHCRGYESILSLGFMSGKDAGMRTRRLIGIGSKGGI